MDASSITAVLRHICALVQLAVAWRLIRTGSYATYRFFVWWQLYCVGRHIVCTFDRSPEVWAAGEKLHIFLVGLAIWEMLAITASRYRQQTRYCLRVLTCTVILAFAACWFGDVHILNGGKAAVREAMFMRRYFSTAYLSTILLSIAFFAIVPVPLPKNLSLHRWLLLAYTATYAVSYSVIHLAPATLAWASAVLMAAVTIIYGMYVWKWERPAQAEIQPMPTDGQAWLEEKKAVKIMTALRSGDRPRERWTGEELQ